MGYLLGFIITFICVVVKEFQKEDAGINLMMMLKACLYSLLWPLVIVGYFFQKNLNVEIKKEDGEFKTDVSFDEKKLMSFKNKQEK